MKRICKYILFATPIIITLLFFAILIYQDIVINLLNLIINSIVYNFGLSHQYYNCAYNIFNQKILAIITIILELFSMISILLIMNILKKDIKEWWKNNIAKSKKENKYK